MTEQHEQGWRELGEQLWAGSDSNEEFEFYLDLVRRTIAVQTSASILASPVAVAPLGILGAPTEAIRDPRK